MIAILDQRIERNKAISAKDEKERKTPDITHDDSPTYSSFARLRGAFK